MLTPHETERAQATWMRLAPEEMCLTMGGEDDPGSPLDLLLQPPPMNPFPPSTGPTFPKPPAHPC